MGCNSVTSQRYLSMELETCSTHFSVKTTSCHFTLYLSLDKTFKEKTFLNKYQTRAIRIFEEGG